MEKIEIGSYNFKNKIWACVSDEAKDFISYLLTYDNNKRQTAKQALQNKWITNIRTQQLAHKSLPMEVNNFMNNLLEFQNETKLR